MHVDPFLSSIFALTKCKAFSLIFLNSEVRAKAFQAVEQFLQILKQNYEKVGTMALPNSFLELFLFLKSY